MSNKTNDNLIIWFMNFPKLRLYYNRKKTATKTIPAVIEIEIYHRRQRKYFSTGVTVLPHQWRDGRVVDHPQAFALNRRIEEAKAPVEMAFNVMAASGESFSFAALESYLKGRNPNGSFPDYVRRMIEERADIRDSTRKTQRRLNPVLKEFGFIQTFSDITRAKIKRFDNWLHSRYDNQATIYFYHKTMKTYINMAIVEGYITNNPYLGMKLKRGETKERRYLRQEELDLLAALDIADRAVMNARDLFLFQCYTGLAFSDMALYDFTVLEQRDGKYILHKRRHKTGVLYHVVLLPPALEILKRHNFKLPIISNQKYNQALKAVAAHTGLRFNLTSHCGRHTYATWCLNNGVDIGTLKTMMGHSDTKTTEIYAKMLNRTVEAAFERLERKLAR